MRKVINYIIAGKETEYYTLISNDRFIIDVIIVNPDNPPHKWGFRRASVIYFDAALATKSRQFIIDEILKPECEKFIII